MKVFPTADGRGVRIDLGAGFSGELRYFVRTGRRTLFPDRIEIRPEGCVEAIFDGPRITDVFSENNGLLKVSRGWEIKSPGRWQLAFAWRPANQTLDRWTVPSVMYHDNRHGTGKFPRGGLETGWSFREDRTPVPACAILYNDRAFQAVFTAPAVSEYEIASVKSHLDGLRPILEIRVPWTEEPRSYTEKGIFLGGLTRRVEKRFRVKQAPSPVGGQGFVYRRDFFVGAADLPHPTAMYETVFRWAMDEFGEFRPGDPPDWSRYVGLKLNHLMFLLARDRGTIGFKMGRGNGLFQGFYEYLMGSFLGKNLEAATVLVRLADELEDEALVDLAVEIGRFFLQGSKGGGVHYDVFDLKKRRWGSYPGPTDDEALRNGVNARCNGEVMLGYLRLYRLLEKRGRPVPEFLRQAEETARFYLDRQLRGELDGCFGRWWRIDGTPINVLGSNGAYIVSFLTALDAFRDGDREIREALERAARYYGDQIDQMLFYADTLDADCVDKEAGIAYLRAFLDLYERYGRPEYLERARQAAAFVLGWTWTYDTPWPSGTAAARAGLKTRGLTAVSVAHHHLDFYGFFCGYDFLRLWKATGDDFYLRTGRMTIDACTRLTATSENPLGRPARFVGWQPEQIDHTRWDYKHRWLGTKGRFHACIAWSVVLALAGLLDIRERFPEVINFRLNKENRPRPDRVIL